MMLVKWHTGNGVWRLAEAANDLRYPDNAANHEVEVRHDLPDGGVSLFPVDCTPDSGVWIDQVDHGHPFWDDIETSIVSERPDGRAFVRCLSWVRPDGDRHMLITDAPVFVMNANGDTIDAVR